MHVEMERAREKLPGEWVQALMDARNVDDAQVSVHVGVHPTTVYRWRRGGIDYATWVGLLTLLGAEADWEPTRPLPPLPTGWRPGDPVPKP